ncbi:MAG: NAD(P)H-dependent oxidoreductase subunit E, partial [Fervidobacterium sp.]
MGEKRFPHVDLQLRKYEYKKELLIQILHGTQESIGYLPTEVLAYISEKLKIPLSRVYGVVTFYNFFKMEKDAEHVIMVCMGTACYVKGAEKVLKAFEEKLGIKSGEITKDRKFSLKIVRCLGCCGIAPAIIVDGKDIY